MSIKNKQWCDWTELYRTGKNLGPEDPRSQPLKKSTGKEHVNEIGKTIVNEILDGFKQEGIRQPTDQEMFGSLVKSEEEIDSAKKLARKEWEATLSKTYEGWQSGLTKAHNFDTKSWGNNRPILDDDQLEELSKDNKDQVKGL